MKLAQAVLLMLTGSAVLPAASILNEGFTDITTLAGSGWVMTNNSAPAGTTGWFQGNPGVFPAQAGPDNSYIGANFENAALGGNISNWLILPQLTLNNGYTVTFYTQGAGFFADRLELRLNPTGTTNVGGTDTSVGDFSMLLLTINPSLDANGYPTAWTQFSVGLSGLAGPTSARLAFRYFVPDTNSNANYIGIDSVAVNDLGIPEPASVVLMGAGLAVIVTRRRIART